jgi:hypothetical protein
MMAKRMGAVELLHRFLLLAVQDGADKYVFRQPDESSCELTAWIRGEKLELVPPFVDDLQAFPAELARLAASAYRWWHCLARWIPWPRFGHQSGRFRYPVGSGTVLVQYRVRWCDSIVTELEVIFGPAVELAG